MRKVFFFCLLICFGHTISAQPQDSLVVKSKFWANYVKVLEYCESHKIFQTVDASATLGTTGIGFDVASPVGDYVQLRAGFEFMPHIRYKMSFGVEVGDNPNESASKFERLSSMLHDFTGYRVDSKVDMIGVPTYYNFKFLADVFPFQQNKHWHFTAGFYWGNSQIAKAYNTTEDMPSLMAVGIYNNIYEKAINKEPFMTIDYKGVPFEWPDDPYEQDILKEKFASYGRMGVRIGEHVSDGSPYVMEPDENSMVKARVMVNSFKPYLGFGYGGRLFKNDDRYKISFDCGALFWGGTPSVITHDGTDLAKDVKNVKYSVGDYVRLVKNVKAFPVLSVRVTRTIY